MTEKGMSMKKLLLIALVCTSTLTYAVVGDIGGDCCGKNLRGVATVGGALGDIEQIMQFEPNYIRKVKAFTNSLCSILTSSGSKTAEYSKVAITNYMKKLNGISNPSGAQMLKFLNSHRNIMTCKDKNKVEKSYMKYAFDSHAYSALFVELFFNDLIPDDESVLINVNAISLTGPDNTPETVLDYILRISSDGSNVKAFNKQVISLANSFIEDLGAKTFTQLKQEAPNEVAEFERLNCLIHSKYRENKSPTHGCQN